ncbi:MAG: SPOR domain-containing protein [Prevotellaceae bacterium]|nr:SPOR domain-containing protein [Prevotellaceae bacterium]
MNEFALCIEYLLLNHDHVTVPGLGTFISQPREAAYDASEETLLPPSREVRFCMELQHEDTFLVTAIRQIYGLTDEEAEGKLCMWTNDFSQALVEQGCVDLGSIGSFSSREGQIVFSPTQAGITAPEYYALDTLHIQEIEPRKRASAPIIRTDAKHITISINKRIANYVAAACVAIVLFFAFSTPVGNTQPVPLHEISASALFMPRNLTLWLGGASNSGFVETGVTASQSSEATTEPRESTKVAVEEQKAEEARYCIVVASAIPQRNAERLVQELMSQGCAKPRILEGKVLRVAVGEYNTEEEARTAVREIHKKGGDYEYAWVYENK